MRLAGFHVDGFGQLRDLDLHDLPPGLTVIEGANEAGKSTLVDFVVGMLFGFPRGNTTRPKHEPLAGGDHGGRVWLDTADDTLLVARTPRRVAVRRLSDESALDDAELGLMLGGANEALYRAVFAVGIDELRSLEALDDDRLNDLVFSAGVVGAGRSATGAMRTLDDARAGLYRARGRTENYRLLGLRADLREAEATLADARRAAASLPGLVRAVEDTAAQIEQARTRAAYLERTQQAMGVLIDLWPVWRAATDAASARAELAEAEPLPPGLVGRLEALAAAEAEAVPALADHQDELAQAQATRRSITVDPTVLAAAPAIDAAVHGLALHDEQRRRLDRLLPRLAELDRVVRQVGHELGPAVDTERLERLARVATAAELEAEGLRARRSHDAAVAAEVAADAALALADQAEARLDARRRSLPSEAPDLVAVAERIGLLEQCAHLARAVPEAPGAAGPGPAPVHRAPAAWTVALTALLGSLALVAALVGALAPAVVLGVLAGAGATSLALMAARSRSESTVPAEGGSSASAAARIELVGLRARLGLPADAAADDIAAALAQARSDLVTAGDEAAALAALRRDTAEATAARRSALATAADAVAAAQSQRHHADQAWRASLGRLGLPEGLGPEAAVRICSLAREATARRGEADALRAEADHLSTACAAYAQQVAVAAAQVGVPVPSTGPGLAPSADIAACVDAMAAVLAQARRAQSRQREIDERVAAAGAGVDRTARRLAAIRSEADDLLAQAGLADLAAAHRAAEIARRRADLDARCTAFDEALALRVPVSAQAQVRARLAAGQPEEWSVERSRATAERAELDVVRDRLAGDLASLQSRRREVEGSADVAAASLAVAGLRAELRAGVRQWMVMGLARGLLAETLARYQRERQPRVLARAQHLFARVTDGRYPSLHTVDRSVVATDLTGRDVSAAVLSRGTREQLYLCLRFALAESYAERVALPVVLDDVLVNFDPVRAEQMASVVAEVADNVQVLAFTCHPWARAMFTRAAPGAAVVELDRASGSLVARRPGRAAGAA